MSEAPVVIEVAPPGEIDPLNVGVEPVIVPVAPNSEVVAAANAAVALANTVAAQAELEAAGTIAEVQGDINQHEYSIEELRESVTWQETELSTIRSQLADQTAMLETLALEREQRLTPEVLGSVTELETVAGEAVAPEQLMPQVAENVADALPVQKTLPAEPAAKPGRKVRWM